MENKYHGIPEPRDSPAECALLDWKIRAKDYGLANFGWEIQQCWYLALNSRLAETKNMPPRPLEKDSFHYGHSCWIASDRRVIPDCNADFRSLAVLPLIDMVPFD